MCLLLVLPSGQFLLSLNTAYVSWILPGLRPHQGMELLGFFPLSLFLSCPKKNVTVMAPLTRGDGKREDKQKASPVF